MIQYRQLNKDEISRELFKNFIRRQNVTLCRRREQGAWVLKSDPFIDDWSEEDYVFGKKENYLDLSSIHVSEDMRGQGIGRILFLSAKEWAKKKNAEKLYISAHSAVETQAFYKAMGCVEAEEYDKKHVEAEPYDCQLECRL